MLKASEPAFFISCRYSPQKVGDFNIFLCVFLCFFRSVLVENSGLSSSSRKIILLRSLWIKSLQHNVPSKRSYIASLLLYCYPPTQTFRASTLLPSWKMNACGSTKNVCVGSRDVLGLRHSFLREEWTRAKALRTFAWEAETLQLYDTKETSMKTSVWKINTHFPKNRLVQFSDL